APSGTTQNSYGATQVESSATVTAGNQYAFSAGPILMNGGTLGLNGFNFSSANLSGSSGYVINGSSTGAATITVGHDNTSTTYSGILANGGTAALNLAKTGTGTLTMTGVNTYTGDTTINGGALQLTSGQNVPNNLYVGVSVSGSFTQSGGTHSVTSYTYL